MSNHRISIVCPSYNHEKYVKYFLDSVFAQTFQDFELIIVDDCSTDNTVKEIEKYNDERIKLIKHTFNQGINATISEAIMAASSDIICINATDDILYENYLEEIIKVFDTTKANVVFVSLQTIDENNNFYQRKLILNPNISKYQMLKTSFMGENPLPSPGIAYRKFVMDSILPLKKGMFQYQDWEYINKMLLNNEIAVIDKCLVKYRISSNSASARNEKMATREKLETDMMMDDFLEIDNLDLFKKIFEGDYEKFGEPKTETIPYFLARLALTSNKYENQAWGYKTLIKYISQGDNYNLINKLYDIKYSEIISLCPVQPVPEREEINYLRKKLLKYKKRYIILSIIIIMMIIIGGYLFWIK